MSVLPEPIQARREYFPRGLVQPEGGFRFSVDSLLLACFAGTRAPHRVLDLGTGCGVVGLALMLLHPDAEFDVLGVDHDPAMIRAAWANAAGLGFDRRFAGVRVDVRNVDQAAGFLPASHDLVLCNPPYRLADSGRMPSSKARQSACFETSASVADFLRAAARALTSKGSLALVHLPEHLQRIFAALTDCALEPKRLRFVHGHEHKPASLLLLEARKDARPGLKVDPPLQLYENGPGGRALTGTARAFCPFLRCNGSRPG